MTDLEVAARELFGLEITRRLPISESFSSEVLLFVATDGSRYVVKRPFAPNKAAREIAALRALEKHAGVPALFGAADHKGSTYLLIEGLDGQTWTDVTQATPEFLRSLGHSMRRLHDVAATDFHGHGTWHELLDANADNYLTAIGYDDQELARDARRRLEAAMTDVPHSSSPSLVHFDLRPGNVLVNAGVLVGLIDFEGCRGGDGSMDFFKLWEEVAPFVPGGLANVLDGYTTPGGLHDDWMHPDQLDRLMKIYATYHGLAGLAWCYLRNNFDGTFPDRNRARMTTLIAS